MSPERAEKYFCSADTRVYINDIWVEEAFHIEYQAVAPKVPVYGFTSLRPDGWGDGRQAVQGNLGLNLRNRNELTLAIEGRAGVLELLNLPADDNESANAARELEPLLRAYVSYIHKNFCNDISSDKIPVIEATGNFVVYYRNPDGVIYRALWLASAKDTKDEELRQRNRLLGYGVQESTFEALWSDLLDFIDTSSGSPTIYNAIRPGCDTIYDDFQAQCFQDIRSNYEAMTAQNRSEDLKAEYWDSKAKERAQNLPTPFDSQYTKRGAKMEIRMGQTELIDDTGILTPDIVIPIYDVHFQSEQMAIGMRTRDYTRVVYPFVASHVG